MPFETSIKRLNMKRIKIMIVLVMASLFANAQNLNNPNKEGPLGTQVNTTSGNLFIPRMDFIIPARGITINVSFFYNSYDFNKNRNFGNGWNFYYNIYYSSDTSDNKIITWGDGREDLYKLQQDASYKAPTGFFDKFSQYEPGKFLLAKTNGDKYFFDNATLKKITRIEEPNGNFINFIYSDTLLTSLVNGAGQTVSFSYNSDGQLSGITDAIATPTRNFSFSYDNVNNLVTATDPLNNKYTYSYLTNGPMKTLADKNANKVDIIYYPNFSISEIVGCNKRISFSYDTLRHTTVATNHMENGNNQVTTYKYRIIDRMAWITDISGNCCGYNLKYEYDDQGNQVKMTDANGNVTTFTYDGNGNMLSMTDALGQTDVYTYSADYNRITSYKDHKGNSYSLSYDTKGNLIQITAPGNQTYSATYNSTGDIITSTDPKGNVFNYNYDAFGNPTTVTGPENYAATLSFDARGNLLSYTDPRGNNTTAQYDILDRLKKITDPINNNIHLTYDANGNAVSVKNKNNEVSTLHYDASDRLTEITDPMNNNGFLYYDAMDNLTSVRNSLGNEIKMDYDTRNRLTAVKDPENNSSHYNYDAHGNVINMTMENGREINFTYDHLHRVTAIADDQGSIATLAYDANGNITSYTNGTGATATATYDNLNRMTKVTDPLGNSYTYTYDQNNNVASATDRNGFTSYYTYDNLNRVKTFTDNIGAVIKIDYDVAGNIFKLTDQNNHATTYTYDELNRQKKTTFADGTYSENFYDNKGNITSVRRTDGSMVTYQYDVLNRLTSKTLPDGQVFAYTYDALGRMLTANNGAGTVVLTYDNLNRVTSETFDGRTTSYQYDIAGRTQTSTYPDGSIIKKEFDTRNRLTRITKNDVTIAQYVYNNADQLLTKTLGNGVITTMQYDFANRLSSITTGSGAIQNTSFTYDKQYNKTAITRNNNLSLSEQFTYDKNYRLTKYKRGTPGETTITENSYTYDALGNRLTANLNGTLNNYTNNNLNQLTSVSGGSNISFQFDGRGNLIYDGKFFKKYDSENRLIRDSSSPSNVIAYEYDALNRRVAKWINGNPLKYSYSGIAQIEERDGANSLLNSTVFTNFLTPVLNTKKGNPFYYHQNELNSVEGISNNNGDLIEQYRYGAYGKLTMFDGSGNPLAGSIAGNRFAFTGQEYDSASGSYRFFFRNYSPETGVFNQRDLIGYGDGMGMYQYVGNNPANGVDVWGLRCGDQSTTTTTNYDVNYFVSQTGNVTAVSGALSTGGRAFWGTEITLNNPVLGIILLPSGIVGTINSGQQLSHYKTNTTAQNYDAATGFVGGVAGSTTGLTTGATFVNAASGYAASGGSGVGSFIAGGEASASLVGGSAALTFGIGLAGGLGIYAITNEGVRLTTGKTLAEHGTDMEIPIYTRSIRNLSDKSVYDTRDIINYHKQNGTLDKWFAAKYKMEQKIKNSNSGGDCPPTGGTRNPPPNGGYPGQSGQFEIISAKDPNEIIGPDGQQDKKWMSTKDRLPYTILFENSIAATAPAKFIRITTPVEPKQDATTLQLGDFGFNSTTFSVKPGTSVYYNRVDARDSIGLYIDVTAGYDQMNNVIFWEFQSIDPVTLMPPNDPLKGFLLLQDSANPTYGHGFVTFSMVPKEDAQTLDTIGAKAEIVFDKNEMIPTNVHTNTLDAVAPQSQLTSATVADNKLTLTWNGQDDPNGSGLNFYTLYISSDGTNFSVFKDRTKRTDTTFTLPPLNTYCFFVLATDSVGNTEALRQGVNQCAFIGGVVPVTWMYFNGKNQGTDNVLTWATASEQNSNRFEIERSLTGNDFSMIGSVKAAGNSNSTSDYSYTDRNIDLLNSTTMYYRLKQFDNNEKFSYSNIVRLSYKEEVASKIIVYPNPTDGQITLSFSDKKLIGTWISVYDDAGRLVTQVRISAMTQGLNLGKYVNGIYLLKFQNNQTVRVIKH